MWVTFFSRTRLEFAACILLACVSSFVSPFSHRVCDIPIIHSGSACVILFNDASRVRDRYISSASLTFLASFLILSL